MGYRLVSMGADVVGLGQYFNGIADAFRQTLGRAGRCLNRESERLREPERTEVRD